MSSKNKIKLSACKRKAVDIRKLSWPTVEGEKKLVTLYRLINVKLLMVITRSDRRTRATYKGDSKAFDLKTKLGELLESIYTCPALLLANHHQPIPIMCATLDIFHIPFCLAAGLVNDTDEPTHYAPKRILLGVINH